MNTHSKVDATAILFPIAITRRIEAVAATDFFRRRWRRREDRRGIGGLVDVRAVILLPERANLYRRCDARFAAMLDGGAVEEVAALLSRGLNPALPVMRAIGVREVARLIRGAMTHSETLAAGQQATRNYAKRQFTWLRHQPPIGWLRVESESYKQTTIIDHILQD